MQDFIEQLKSMDRNQLILTAAKLKKETIPEPIAIVGIGCRFPGGMDSAKDFWQKVSDGEDMVTDISDKRWNQSDFYDGNPDAPGKTYVKHMALLDKADEFDAAFFNIHKTEADLMDPQQRWLLEESWHALEDANIAPSSIKGQDVGVYVGLMNHDYEHLQNLSGDISKVCGYSAVGSATSVAAGRIAYFLGVQGPTITLDTACSSSLVSVHLACQALRNRECTMALAGGVNSILSPTTTIAESKAMMLSPTGKCHTYDEQADGYVRGEGCGMVVLKTLSDAKKDGDRIYALIRGSAVNQDGASQGLTSPNGISQRKVIEHALKQANIPAKSVGFIETHGTGTPLGDPIEISALCESYQTDTRSFPLYISSIKTNIGHTESAAGIAGLIKLSLSRYNSKLVKHLNLNELNKYIDLKSHKLVILKENTSWPEESPFGAISSFGFSGTNAHLIIGPAPQRENTDQNELAASQSNVPPIFLASAASTTSLENYTSQLNALVQNNPSQQNRIAAATQFNREHLEYRSAWRLGKTPPKAIKKKNHLKPMCALFTGQGAQIAGMGKELYENYPMFKETFDLCDLEFQQYYGFSLSQVMWGDRSNEINQTQFTQPVLFAFEFSLMKLWHHWGIKPNYLLGHSVGEYAAACYAEVFSVRDGMRLIIARGELMQQLCQTGAMLAIALGETETSQHLKEFSELDICVINGPESTVVGGPKSSVADLQEHLKLHNIRCKALSVSHAFHSPMMEPMLDKFLQVANEIDYTNPKIPIISSSQGDHADFAQANYWVQHVTQPVRFLSATNSAIDLGIQNWLELGPQPILCGLLRGQLTDDTSHQWIHLDCSSSSPTTEQLVDSVAQLYSMNWNVNWQNYNEKASVESIKNIDLPVYSFDRQRFWFCKDKIFTLANLADSNEQNTDTIEEYKEETNSVANPFLNEIINKDTESQWLSLVSTTRNQIAAVLNLEEEEIPLDVDLFDLGLDSMKAMDLRAKVQQEIGYDLSARLLFDYPNVLSLVDYFGIELLKIWESSPVADELA